MCVKQTYYDIYMHVSTHTQAQRQEERGSSMCTKISFKNMKILLSALHSAALEKASPSDPAYHPHASSPFLGVHRGLSCVPRPTLFTPDTTLWLSEFSYVSTSSLFFFFFFCTKKITWMDIFVPCCRIFCGFPTTMVIFVSEAILS